MAKILIVDDDDLMSQMYDQAFKISGYTVLLASSGKDALEKIRDFNPDIILLDIMMPEVSGVDVLSKLKADPDLSNIPVIMLTNLSGQEDTVTALSKGAIRYIVKSEHDPDDVVNLVKDILVSQKRDAFNGDDPDSDRSYD